MHDVLLKNAYSKSGKVQGSVIDIEGTEKVTPMIIDDCQKGPEGSQPSAVAGNAARSIVVVIAAVLCGTGCVSIGPQTIPKDRVDYLDSIGESSKRQTLLNMLRLRYMDTPMFIDVSSVVASYGVGATVGADAKVGTTSAASSLSQVGVSGAVKVVS